MKKACFFVVGILAFAGCSQVPSGNNRPDMASMGDDGKPTSGLISQVLVGSEWVYTVDAGWRSHYNRLVKVYGATWDLLPDSGLVDTRNGRFTTDSKHYSYFLQMNRFAENGLK